MTWWIDPGFNVLLFIFFGYLAFRILILKKAILLGSTLYCSALMLGLITLSLNDVILMQENGWSLQPEFWKGWLFYLGSVIYLFLIPRMIKEFFVFHISERDYRNLSVTFFNAMDEKYSFDPEGYTFKSEEKQGIWVFYHFSMKFGIWSSVQLKDAFLNARRVMTKHIKALPSYRAFSWQGLFFLVISLLLFMRALSMLYSWSM